MKSMVTVILACALSSDVDSLSGSLEAIDQITQIHEDSPYLNELFQGDSWKKVISNLPKVPTNIKKDKKDDTK